MHENHFEALRLGPLLLLGGQHGHDGDALDLELGVDPHHVAGLGIGRQEGAVKDAPGLERPGGTPRPAAIGPRTGQLDIDPACHGA